MNISFAQLIKIDRRKADALYLQIVYQFIQAVQQGVLREGQQLPGSRIISKELNVHRKTVIAALEELKMQGWIETKASVGTFVKNLPLKNKNTVYQRATDLDYAAFNYRKSFILDSASNQNNCSYYFTDGTPDYRIIKMTELSRYYSSALKRKNVIKKISENPLESNAYFLEQLSYYLNLTRGLHISTKNMMLTNNRQSLLYILTQLLIHQGDMVLVAAYSYYLSNMTFQQSGAKVHTIPIDKNGIQVEYIAKNYNPGQIKLIYLQSQHQYPTTYSLSEERKMELLKLSEAYDFIIVEDDYSYELSYAHSSHSSLFRAAQTNRCVYIGEFGKYLTPGFQTSFLLGPQDFIAEGKKYLSLFGNADVVKEQALAEMIYEGHIHRYRRKVLKIYEYRRHVFNTLLQKYFGNEISYLIPDGGLAYWINFKYSISLITLAKNAKNLGLHIPSTCFYQDKNISALRIGFAHFDKDEMSQAVAIFHQAYQITFQSV